MADVVVCVDCRSPGGADRFFDDAGLTSVVETSRGIVSGT